jgi:uncharacterized cupredoxin-like copper-binding protein
MRPRPLSVLAVLALALAATGVAAARPARTHATTVKVTAKDYSFVLSHARVPHGKVTFEIRNDGRTAHDFAIDGRTSMTIEPGKTTTLTVTFTRAGRYPYRCTIDSHAQLGMKGTLRVT